MVSNLLLYSASRAASSGCSWWYSSLRVRKSPCQLLCLSRLVYSPSSSNQGSSYSLYHPAGYEDADSILPLEGSPPMWEAALVATVFPSFHI